MSKNTSKNSVVTTNPMTASQYSAALMNNGITADQVADMIVSKYNELDNSVYSMRLHQCYYIAMMDNSVSACLTVEVDDAKKGGRKPTAEKLGEKWAEKNLHLSRTQFYAAKRIGELLTMDDNNGIVVPKALEGYNMSALEVIASKSANSGKDISGYIADKGLNPDMSVREIKQATATEKTKAKKAEEVEIHTLRIWRNKEVIATLQYVSNDSDLVDEAVNNIRQGFKKGYGIEIVTEE